MLAKGLRDLLLADGDIAAMCGNAVRIGRAPEGTSYPLAVIHPVTPEYFIGLQGTNALQGKLVQFDCWAKTPREADLLSQAVHNLLNNFRGVLSEGTTVLSCFPTNDLWQEDEQLRLSAVMSDFKMFFVPGEFIQGVDVIGDDTYWEEF